MAVAYHQPLHCVTTWLLLVCSVGACAPPACSDGQERAMQMEVELLVKDDGPLARAASEQLVRRGRPSIVVLETGLYNAGPLARLRIIKTLGQIGLSETSPIFAHLARRDPAPEVREAAKRALMATKITR